MSLLAGENLHVAYRNDTGNQAPIGCFEQIKYGWRRKLISKIRKKSRKTPP
jgi:hypothetical protein